MIVVRYFFFSVDTSLKSRSWEWLLNLQARWSTLESVICLPYHGLSPKTLKATSFLLFELFSTYLNLSTNFGGSSSRVVRGASLERGNKWKPKDPRFAPRPRQSFIFQLILWKHLRLSVLFQVSPVPGVTVKEISCGSSHTVAIDEKYRVIRTAGAQVVEQRMLRFRGSRLNPAWQCSFHWRGFHAFQTSECRKLSVSSNLFSFFNPIWAYWDYFAPDSRATHLYFNCFLRKQIEISILEVHDLRILHWWRKVGKDRKKNKKKPITRRDSNL